MHTYLIWLKRILWLLAVCCAIFAGFGYFGMSPDGPDGGGAIALIYAAIIGAIGFAVTALATHFIAKNFQQK